MKVNPIGEVRLTVGQVLFGDLKRPVEALFNALQDPEGHDLPDVLVVFLRSHPEKNQFEIVDRRDDADHHLLIIPLTVLPVVGANATFWYAEGEPKEREAFAARIANQYGRVCSAHDPTDWAMIVPIDTIATDQWPDPIGQDSGSLSWAMLVGRIGEGNEIGLFE